MTTHTPANAAPELNFMSCIEAHVRWKVRLEAYINGTSEEHLDPEVICKDNQCLLGKWIYSDGGVKYGNHPIFIEMKETHRLFHLCASNIVRTVDGGQPDKALEMLHSGDYARHSHRIKSELARLSIQLENGTW